METNKKRGLLIVLSGPSGVGKGTVREAIFAESQDFDYSISATTRASRPGEVHGKDYFFLTKEKFEAMLAADEFLEYAKYVDHYYGTPLAYVEETLASGRDVFLEIEVQGALKVKEKMPEGIFIFLTPPDLIELEQRIKLRGTDSDAVIAKRMEKAREELSMMVHYDYAVENDQVHLAVERIKAIITSEHLKVDRVLADFTDLR